MICKIKENPLAAEQSVKSQIKPLWIINKLNELAVDLFTAKNVLSYETVIDTAKEIIDYYETCKSKTPFDMKRKAKEKERIGKILNPDGIEKNDYNYEKYITPETIAERLEKGTFLPFELIEQGFRFFQWERWNFKHYGIKSGPEGIFDLKKRLDLLTELKTGKPWKLALQMGLIPNWANNIAKRESQWFKNSIIYADSKKMIPDEEFIKLLEKNGVNPKDYSLYLDSGK